MRGLSRLHPPGVQIESGQKQSLGGGMCDPVPRPITTSGDCPGGPQGRRLAHHAAGKEKPVKQRIRTILFGTTAATTIGLTALVGCRSNDGDSSLAAKPDTGHVAAVMMKLSWPPGAAQHERSE